MHSLNRKILSYLLALWLGLAAIGALGYARLQVVHRTSSDLINSIYPSASAALEVETAIYEAYQNTILHCSYLQEGTKGTGLGLSIVHGIIESHGGSIQLHTEQGQGTEFQVFLPAAEEPNIIVGLLQKPFELNRLSSTVREVLDQTLVPA